VREITRYFSTATTQATGMPTAGVRIITAHSAAPTAGSLPPSPLAAPMTSSTTQKRATAPT
jgi:hypothetical protein